MLTWQHHGNHQGGDMYTPLLTMLGITCIMAVFETIFLYLVILPDIKAQTDTLKRKLRDAVGSRVGDRVKGLLDQWDDATRKHVVFGVSSPWLLLLHVLHESERRQVEERNQSVLFCGIFVVLVPLLIAVGVVTQRRPTSAKIKEVCIHVLTVVTDLIALQLFFYRMALRWSYVDDKQLLDFTLSIYEKNTTHNHTPTSTE